MKITRWILGILMVGLLAFTACKKADSGPKLDPVDVNGVKVDLPKLQATFGDTSTPDQQTSSRNVVMAFRYGQYEKALLELDKLANDSSLNDAQKKVVTDVIEQVKQVMSKAPAPTQ
jgi:hypothetical protein